MSPAATRLAALGALTVLTCADPRAAKGAATSGHVVAWLTSASVGLTAAAPTRPTVVPGLRIADVDYVSATDLVLWLGLKGAWAEPRRRFLLTDKANPANRAELNADSRETTINGLRVFLGAPTVLRADRLYVSKIDVERCLAPLLRPGLGARLPPPPKIIVLDPGHGGKDDGAENKGVGVKEKTMTLDVALRLKKLLEAAGYKVMLTRTGDEPLSPIKAVDLALRPEFANREHADLFVSIHFNAIESDARSTRGTETYTYPPRLQHATEWWSQWHRDDPDLQTEEQPANRFDHWNMVLAQAMHRAMLQTLKTEDRGKKIRHLAVLKTLNCPGVLVEPAFVTDDGEARRILSPAFRQQAAEALAAGIRSYAGTLDALRPQPAAAVSPGSTPATK